MVRASKGATPKAAEKAFAAVAAESPGGYRLLARLRAAAEAGKARPGPVPAYAAIADDASVGHGPARPRAPARRAAAPRQGRARDPEHPSESLAAPTSAFRHTAREMLGLAALRKGDYDKAGSWFEQITTDRETPPACASASRSTSRWWPGARSRSPTPRRPPSGRPPPPPCRRRRRGREPPRLCGRWFQIVDSRVEFLSAKSPLPFGRGGFRQVLQILSRQVTLPCRCPPSRSSGVRTSASRRCSTASSGASSPWSTTVRA